MLKNLKYFMFVLVLLFCFALDVKADSLPAAKSGKITLDRNYTIESISFDSGSVNVLDLNGYSLTLNGTLCLNKNFEIKNGTIIRKSSFTDGTLIKINGNVEVNLKDIIIDGNEVDVNPGSANGTGYAVFVGGNAMAILDGVELKKHYSGKNVSAAGIYATGAKKIVVNNSKIHNNKALSDSPDAVAMAVFATGSVEIKNTKIYENYAAVGGSSINMDKVGKVLFDEDSSVKNKGDSNIRGMRLVDTAGTISGVFEGNGTKVDNGAGLYVLFRSNNVSDYVVNITSSAKFINNVSAFAGGGLYVNAARETNPGKVVINGATFSGNKALGTVDASSGLYKDVGGGGITVARGILEINDINMNGNSASIEKGNGIMVSHANETVNGGKLTINGGTFKNSIDLGAGSIVVNGGTFTDDMSEYITDESLISKKTTDGYKVVKKPILLVSVSGKTEDSVVLNSTDSIDLDFNDLNQEVVYTIKLKNTSKNKMYVNDLIVDGITDDFIEFVLSDKSMNAKIAPGEEKEIKVLARTLKQTHAGKNYDGDVTLKIILDTEIENPATYSNWLVYLLLIAILLVTTRNVLDKVNRKKGYSILVLAVVFAGLLCVSADDSDYVVLNGKVRYISQNLMQESGVKFNNGQADYANSSDVWKYASQVKNIIILDEKIKVKDYAYKFDLTKDSSKRIYGYLVDNDDVKDMYDLYITANGIIYAPEDSTGLFSFPNVEKIQGLEFIEFDNTTNMTAMFFDDKKLSSLDVSCIDVSKVVNTSYMFNGCDKLAVSEKDFNLENVTNKSYMFNVVLNNVVKTGAKSDSNVDFSKAPETGTYFIESTKNDTNPIYYYRGAVTDNNVVFGGYCWKMVRTTDTGGTKLIYNGVSNTSYTKYEFASYENVINTSGDPFVFDSTTNKWTSTNKQDNSSSSIKFNVATEGYYFINYEISSEYGYDYVWVYKDGVFLNRYSGLYEGRIDLGYIPTTTEIEIKYTKDSNRANYDDSVTFFVAKGLEWNPVCNNSSENTHIGITKFNYQTNSPAYSGYMYGTAYEDYSKNMSGSGVYAYGNDISWDGEKYSLSEDMVLSSNWNADRETLAKKYHYTCFNNTGVCDEVYYISCFGDSTNAYYLTLKDGEDIEDVKDKMFTNTKDSYVKQMVDNWYATNMTSYTSYLEDTVWCNDREFVSGPLQGKDAGDLLADRFASYNRNVVIFKPTVNCTNKNDSFTVSSKNGNGKLVYPVGLLTADEYTLAGNGSSGYSTSTYLYNGQGQWTMSPTMFYFKNTGAFRAISGISNYYVNDNYGVRPSISLNASAKVLSGDGNALNPYVIK